MQRRAAVFNLGIPCGLLALCESRNSLCLCGAGFFRVAGQQFSRTAGCSCHAGEHIAPGVCTVQCIQLCLCGIVLACLVFQIIVISILCAFTAQAVSNNAVYLLLREGARLLLLSGCSGTGFLCYSFIHGGSFLGQSAGRKPVLDQCTVFFFIWSGGVIADSSNAFRFRRVHVMRVAVQTPGKCIHLFSVRRTGDNKSTFPGFA